jgi:hypothetical protein
MRGSILRSTPQNGYTTAHEGLSNQEIAPRLNIATHTVKSHVRNVMEKLALHSRLQIAGYSHREGTAQAAQGRFAARGSLVSRSSARPPTQRVENGSSPGSYDTVAQTAYLLFHPFVRWVPNAITATLSDVLPLSRRASEAMSSPAPHVSQAFPSSRLQDGAQMSRSLLTGMLALGFVACSGGAAKELPNQDATASSPSGSAAGTPSGATADSRRGSVEGSRRGSSGRSLASGTRVDATIQDALSSRTNKVGETLRATVSGDVKDARGDVVIPAGSTVTLTIAQLEPGSDQVRPEGRLSLVVSSVTVNGQEHPVTANLEPVPHHLQGRGVTTDEAARVGAGTAIGALAGQVIGKNTKSTVIGGAIGAVAGTAVAVRYAYRDVIVSAGTPIVFTLTQSLNVSAR